MRKKLTLLCVLLVAIAALVAGCGHTNSAVIRDSKITNAYSAALEHAVPYPLSQMKDSQERRNLRERLLRFNRPDKLGYVYLLGMNGNYVGYYAIHGKPSSMESQLTATQQIVKACNSGCREVVTSMGDDGSFGGNEAGIFFFTTNGVLVETSMNYVYSDAPLPVDAPKLNPKQGVKDLSDR
jgi:predicted small secreted protein